MGVRGAVMGSQAPRPVRLGHPFDTPLRATLRFAVELIAWLVGVSFAHDVGGGVAAVAALLVGVAVPAVCSTPGDKRVVVATPGPIRAVIEGVLYAIALVLPWALGRPRSAVRRRRWWCSRWSPAGLA